LASSSEATVFLFLIERMRLSLSPHPQLSVIARPVGLNPRQPITVPPTFQLSIGQDLADADRVIDHSACTAADPFVKFSDHGHIGFSAIVKIPIGTLL
jgi:hypothetical protein